MNEGLKPDSYEVFMEQEIEELSYSYTDVDGGSSVHNPLRDGVFTLQHQLGRMPLWGQPFAEKPFQPSRMNTVSVNQPLLNRGLEKLGLSRHCPNELEREIIHHRRWGDALVERGYLTSRFEGRIDPMYIATLVRTHGPNIYELVVQTPRAAKIGVAEFFKPEIRSFEDLLQMETPVAPIDELSFL
jgi:hypothetical protein